MRKINYPLIMGLILIFVLLLISFFPKQFTNIDPNYKHTFRVYDVIENGETLQKYEMPPLSPNEKNIFGTDELGRDIYARLIYGTRITLKSALYVVVSRFLLALILGIFAGVGSRIASSIIKIFNTVFTAIPSLLAAFIVLNIGFIARLQVEQSIVAFAVVLTVVGWGKLAAQIEEKSKMIMTEDFIEGEIAVGKNKFQIAMQNLLPHLIPSLISLFFLEIGLVLFLLAQLSVLSVFIGPRRMFVREEGIPGWMVSVEPEWASILSRGVINLKMGNYWIALYPAITFAVGIMAFNLTGEGLRVEFEKRTSRVVSFIKKLGFVFSPKVYYHQIKRFKEYYRPVIVKSLCICIITGYIFMPPPKSLYVFNVDLAMEHIEELSQPKYQGRISGFDGGYQAGEYIISKLKEYGLQTYDGESFVQEFPSFMEEKMNAKYAVTRNRVVVQEGEITLTDDQGQKAIYRLGKDFIITGVDESYIRSESVERDEIVIRGRNYTVEEYYSPEIEKHGEVMLTEKVQDYRQLTNKVYKVAPVAGPNVKVSFFLIDKIPEAVIPCITQNCNFVIPFGELKERLEKEHLNIELKFSFPQKPPHEARNIFAVLPGKNWNQPNDSNNKKEIIMIGSSYDGIGSDGRFYNTGAIGVSGTAVNLEIARILTSINSQFNKTIVFAFWDGENMVNSGSRYYNVKDRIFNTRHYKMIYFDIGLIGDDSVEEVAVNIESSAVQQIETYDIEESIKERIKKKNIEYRFGYGRSKAYQNIANSAELNIFFGAVDYNKINTPSDQPEAVSRKNLYNIGQLIIDIITLDENFQ